jgi:multiple sugar transport system substrate-binding protein
MTDTEAQEIVADYSEDPVNLGVQHDARLVTLHPVLMASHRANQVTRPADTPAYPALSKAIYTEVNAAVEGKITSQAALAAAMKGMARAMSSGAG